MKVRDIPKAIGDITLPDRAALDRVRAQVLEFAVALVVAGVVYAALWGVGQIIPGLRLRPSSMVVLSSVGALAWKKSRDGRT
jgi:hypothetical protein